MGKTGNARQGSRRTPLRPGGGVIFGPKPRDFSIDMNQKERRIAMATALQSASEDVIVIEDLGGKFDSPKTKDMANFLTRVGTKPSEEKVLGCRGTETQRSFVCSQYRSSANQQADLPQNYRCSWC